MSKVKEFEDILEQLNIKQAEYLLADLRDESKRKPQLYTAIRQFLEFHKYKVAGVGQPEDSILGDLASEVPELTEDEMTTGYIQ